MAPASARSAPSISATRRVLSWMPTRSSSSSMKLLSQSTIRRIFSRVTRRMPARRQRHTSPLCTAALLLRAQRSAADVRPLSKQRSSTCRRRRFARCSPQPRSPQPRSPQPRSPQPRSPQPRSPQPRLCRLRGRSPAASAPPPRHRSRDLRSSCLWRRPLPPVQPRGRVARRPPPLLRARSLVQGSLVQRSRVRRLQRRRHRQRQRHSRCALLVCTCPR